MNKKRVARTVAGILAFGLLATACADDAADSDGDDPVAEETQDDAADDPTEEPTEEEPTEDDTSDDGASDDEQAAGEEGENIAPYDGAEAGSGEGLKIGYISLGESIPFVKIVSDSIREEAEIAGAELIFCDSEIDAAKALDCARSFATQGVDGIINFQLDAQASPEICAAGPDVPTIAIDIPQEPCQTAFMGADNFRAGFIGGEAVGRFFDAEFECEYDAVLMLGDPASGQVFEDRTGGMREGFESVCGEVPDDKFRALNGQTTIDGGQQVMRDALTALPGATRLPTFSMNDDMLLGAFAAAESLGRGDHLWASAQNADPTSFEPILNDENWIGDVAYFPERYGGIAVPAVIDAIEAQRGEGDPVQELLFVDHEFLSDENLLDFYPDADSQ